MKKIWLKNKSVAGFTLIEMLVVIAILGMVIGAGYFMLDSQTRSKVSLEGAQADVLNALQLARNQAATGVGQAGTDHGVRISASGDQIINFSTGTADTVDYHTELPPGVSVSGLNDIIFNRLSATSNQDAIITITLNDQTATVSVATSGSIEK